jgi:hypothetical protein
MNELILANGGRLEATDAVLIQKANQEIARLAKELQRKEKELNDLRDLSQKLQ